MAISLCIKGREEMTEKIIIKPSVQKRFDSFMVHGRVLFFSAPCGFGKTVLADALLRGRNVLRQSAAAPDWAIPSSAQDWDILLIDDLQLMQEEAGQQALCELIRSSPVSYTHLDVYKRQSQRSIFLKTNDVVLDKSFIELGNIQIGRAHV